MLTNPRSDRVKSVRALGRRVVRRREGLFLAEGPQAVREAVVHRPDVVKVLYYDATGASRHTAILAAAGAAALPVQEVSAEVLAAMCDTQAPQGIAAVCRRLDASLDHVLGAAPQLLVVLTHVRDPGNAGTVIRAADASGADAVLVSEASVDIYNPKVVRSTAGSLFHLPIVTGVAVAELLRRVRGAGLALLAADWAGSTLIGDADLSRPHAWVMGNEAWGLEREVRDACDGVVRVPIYGKAESLNLAMAATVCLYASAATGHNHRVTG